MQLIATSPVQEPFDALLRAHWDHLYRHACRLASSREDAEDLLQQSLLEAYLAFDRFAAGSHFDRWVMRIMYRTFIDTMRRRPRCVIQSLDGTWETEEGAGAGRPVADPRGGPEAELVENLPSEPLQQALEGLPAAFRAAVLLADLQGLSYEEVARVQGCPVGTVRSRLHQARARLRGILGHSAVAREKGTRTERRCDTVPAAG